MLFWLGGVRTRSVVNNINCRARTERYSLKFGKLFFVVPGGYIPTFSVLGCWIQTHITLPTQNSWGRCTCIRKAVFPDLATNWRRVVSFTPQPLYPRGKSPRYPLDRRLGGPQSQSGWRWRRENSWPYRDSNSDPSVVQPVASSCTDYAIPLYFHAKYADLS
jgi:hypothetical protein